MMKKGVLIINSTDIEGKLRYHGYALVDGKTLHLTNYELEDDLLNQKECEVEDQGGVVTKLVVDGVEIKRKCPVSTAAAEDDVGGEASFSAMNVRREAGGEKQCIEPVKNSREAYAYWHACNRINEGVEKYSEQVNTVPMLIRRNGLGAALMYMRIQETRVALVKIYEDIVDWLHRDEKGLIQLEDGQDLADEIVTLTQDAYRDITHEVLAYLAFLKRFAKGLSK